MNVYFDLSLEQKTCLIMYITYMYIYISVLLFHSRCFPGSPASSQLDVADQSFISHTSGIALQPMSPIDVPGPSRGSNRWRALGGTAGRIQEPQAEKEGASVEVRRNPTPPEMDQESLRSGIWMKMDCFLQWKILNWISDAKSKKNLICYDQPFPPAGSLICFPKMFELFNH